jgi:hypothetical protein
MGVNRYLDMKKILPFRIQHVVQTASPSISGSRSYGTGGSRLQSSLLRRPRSGGLRFRASLGKWFCETHLKKKSITIKGLVEWLKV